MRSCIYVAIILVAILLCVLACGACASIDVYHDYQANMGGVMYRLPRGVLLVSIPITRSDYMATELTRYAMEKKGVFKGLPPIIVPKEWQDSGNQLPPATGDKLVLFKHATPVLEYAVEPDPEQCYFIRLKGDATQNRNLTLALNNMGVLTEGGSQVQDKKLELAMATIEAAARIGASSAGLAIREQIASPPPDELKAVAEAEALALRTELGQIQTERHRWVIDNPIVKPAVLSAALNAFDAREAQIIASFLQVKSQTFAVVFEIRPTMDGTINSENGRRPAVWKNTLLTLDRSNGVSYWVQGAKDDIVGPMALPAALFKKTEPNQEKPCDKTNSVVETVPDKGSAADGERTSIQMSLTKNAAYELRSRPPAKVKQPSGFVYRIPGAVDVRISSFDKNVLKQHFIYRTMQIPQVGYIAALPRDAGLSPEHRVAIALYEKTGALKSIEVESKSIDPARIQSFGANISESIDKLAEARQAAAAAAAERPSRIAKLTAQVKEFSELVSALKAAGLPVPPLPDPTGMVESE